MNALTVYNFNNNDVRLVMQGDDPWFVAKDVCEVLGFSDTNAGTRHLDDDELMSVKLTGMNMMSTLISEPGLYALIQKSRKPEAKMFKRWVNHEVLPSIRKHGAYMTESTLDKALTDPDFLIKLANQLGAERTKRIDAERKRAMMSAGLTTCLEYRLREIVHGWTSRM